MKKKQWMRVTMGTVLMVAAASMAGCGEVQNTGMDGSAEESSFEEIEETQLTAKVSLDDSQIEIDGDGVTEEDGKLTITKGGVYEFQGALTEGQIVVEAAGQDVTIVLNGVTLTCSVKDAIFIKEADSAVLWLAEGSENTLTSGTRDDYDAGIETIKAKLEEALETANEKETSEASKTEEAETSHTESLEETEGTSTAGESSEERTSETAEASENSETEETLDNSQKAAIYSKCDLVITGGGSLTVNGYINNGIQSKENLTMKPTGSVTVTALNDGIKGKEDLTIASGTYSITAYGDGISAGADLQIDDGIFTVTTGGGASESAAHTNEEGMPGAPGMRPGMAAGEGSGGEMPQNGESAQKPEEMPQYRESAQKPEEWPQDGEMPQMPDGTFVGMDQQSDADDNAYSVSQKGIKADGALTINGGTYTIDTADDGLHSGGDLTVRAGDLTIRTGDDGLHSDTDLTIYDGTVQVEEAYEGIEGTTITIEGGNIHIVTKDDGLNAASDTDTPLLTINGGTLYVNAEGDGIDSNGDLIMNGGEVYVDGPSNGGNAALDIGVESGGILQINGGSLTAIGMSGMLENVDESSDQMSIVYVFAETLEADTEVSVTDQSGNSVATFTLTKDADSVILSNDSLKLDEVYTFTYGDTTEEITADKLCTTNYEGKGMGGMGMGFMP